MMNEPSTARSGATEDARSALLRERMLPLYAIVERRVDRLLHERHHLGLSSAMALAAVAETDDQGVAQAAVAGKPGLSASATSRLLAQLEDAGQVRRRAVPGDRRTLMVSLTDIGRGLWDRAAHTLDEALHREYTTLAFDADYAHVVARLCRPEAAPRTVDRPITGGCSATSAR